MDLKKHFEVDKALEEEGAWFDVGDGGRLKIARRNNRRYREHLRRLTRGKEQQLRLNVLPEAAAEEMLVKALAGCVLLDWKGIEIDGKEVQYSEATAAEFMRAYPDFRELVDALADDIEAFRQSQDEEAEKNSAKSSASG